MFVVKLNARNACYVWATLFAVIAATGYAVAFAGGPRLGLVVSGLAAASGYVSAFQAIRYLSRPPEEAPGGNREKAIVGNVAAALGGFTVALFQLLVAP